MGCDDTSNQTGETTMIRKFVLAVAAVAALGTVSLTASTPAAAGFWHKGHHHHHHHGFHWRGGLRPLRRRATTRACAAAGSSIATARWCSAWSTSATKKQLIGAKPKKPRPRASETGVFFLDPRTFRRRSGDVEAIGVHHLGPRRHEVLDELLLRVRARIDLRERAQLRVRAEDQVDPGAGPLDRVASCGRGPRTRCRRPAATACPCRAG